MLLHIDGSRHQWFQDERWYDLIVILDDASSEIYYAQLVEEESTVTVMAGLKEVIERKGVFCAMYSDRGSHFWLTPKVGGKVDYHRRTQVGRALHELGVQMIPAYSPQARGRSERNFGTWQGRLPQELRLRQLRTLGAANRFLREDYIAEFNRRFLCPPDLDKNDALDARRSISFSDSHSSAQHVKMENMPAPLKAIFFDVGNTLLFPDRLHILAPLQRRNLSPSLEHWHAIARKTKREFDDISEQHDGKADHSFWYLFYSHLLADLEIQDDGLRDTLVSATRISANWCDILPGTRESLLRLGQRYPLADHLQCGR